MENDNNSPDGVHDLSTVTKLEESVGDKTNSREVINIKNVLSQLKTEYCRKRSAQCVFRVQKILKVTISFLISERKFTEKMDALNELLMSGLSDWNDHDINILDGILIPADVLGDYQKEEEIRGFGNAARSIIRDRIIRLEKKNILVLGWIRICRLRNVGGIMVLDQQTDNKTDDVIKILDGIRSNFTSNSTTIDAEQTERLNAAIPWGEEIMEYSFLKYFNYVMVDGDVTEKKKRLNCLICLISDCVPADLFFYNERDKTKFVEKLRTITFSAWGGVNIDTESKTIFFTARCRVGILDLLYTQSQLIKDNGDVFIGSLFQNIANLRNIYDFNQSVIDMLIYELYTVINIDFIKKKTADLSSMDMVCCSSAMSKIKNFVNTERKSLDYDSISKFNHGCILLNNQEKISLKIKDIPLVITDYLGLLIYGDRPPPIDMDGELCAGEFDILNFFKEKSNQNIFKLDKGQFKTTYNQDFNVVFDGVENDRYIFERYCNENVYTIPHHLEKKIIINMLHDIGESGARFILAGGMACMLRFNCGRDAELEHFCQKYMHRFSRMDEEKYTKKCKMNGQPIDPKKLRNIARKNIKDRLAAYEFLLNSGYAYSTWLGGDKNFQYMIDDFFLRFQIPGNNFLEAWDNLCSIDIFFAENLILFGFAVLFRGCIESRKNKFFKDKAFDKIFSDKKIEEDVKSRANSFFDKDDNQNAHWNILSVIIHAWDENDKRFANKYNLKQRMPIIRWEILYLFFEIIYQPNPDFKKKQLFQKGILAGEGDVPFLRAKLESINSTLDHLINLFIE